VSYESAESSAEHVEIFLKGLVQRMGLKAKPEITEADGVVSVNLTGEDPGMLIGRRGETLDAIQHLTNYVINRNASGRVRVNVDTENYRQRRNEALERLADKVAAKAVKYKRNMTLEPMNSYERHIIHTALQEYENVTTYSIGTEPNRRVVVVYERKGGTKPAPTFREWC
jgi:spoIIIJ-associated protein